MTTSKGACKDKETLACEALSTVVSIEVSKCFIYKILCVLISLCLLLTVVLILIDRLTSFGGYDKSRQYLHREPNSKRLLALQKYETDTFPAPCHAEHFR